MGLKLRLKAVVGDGVGVRDGAGVWIARHRKFVFIQATNMEKKKIDKLAFWDTASTTATVFLHFTTGETLLVVF